MDIKKKIKRGQYNHKELHKVELNKLFDELNKKEDNKDVTTSNK